MIKIRTIATCQVQWTEQRCPVNECNGIGKDLQMEMITVSFRMKLSCYPCTEYFNMELNLHLALSREDIVEHITKVILETI